MNKLTEDDINMIVAGVQLVIVAVLGIGLYLVMG